MPIPIVLSGGSAEQHVDPPTEGEGTSLTFYLLPQQLGRGFYQRMTAFPARVSFGASTGLYLVGALTTETQDTAIRQTYPQPADWNGSAAMAARVMRENNLVNWWWIFDWFMASSDRPVRTISGAPTGSPDPAPFSTASFNSSIVGNPNGTVPFDPAVYEVTTSVTPRSGGVDVTFTVKNISAADADWPCFYLPVPAYDYRGVWMGRHKWKRFTSPQPFISGQHDILYGGGPPNGATFNALSLDTDGSGALHTIGWGTDFAYATQTIIASYAANAISVFPNRAINGQVLPLWFRPGESKSITFWLRHKAAVGESATVESIQPYTDYIRAVLPFSHPTKLHGRIAGTLLADGGGDAAHRYYRSYGGLRPDQFSGWSALLDAVCNTNWGGAANMVANSYKGVMLWTVSGFLNDLSNDFIPNVITTLPANLASTLSEIATWEAANGLKLFFWIGHCFGSYQTGAYNSALINSLATGYYLGSLPPGWQSWTLLPAATASWADNIDAALSAGGGAGFDAMPEPAYDPWINPQVAARRVAFPTKYMIGENEGTDRKMQRVPPYYLTSFEGRCPVLEVLMPGFEPVVQTGGGNDADSIARSLYVESQRAVCITLGAVLTAPYVPYP